MVGIFLRFFSLGQFQICHVCHKNNQSQIQVQTLGVKAQEAEDSLMQNITSTLLHQSSVKYSISVVQMFVRHALAT